MERNRSGLPVGIVRHHGLDAVNLERAGQIPPVSLKHGSSVRRKTSIPCDLLIRSPARQSAVERWIVTEGNEWEGDGGRTRLRRPARRGAFLYASKAVNCLATFS